MCIIITTILTIFSVDFGLMSAVYLEIIQTANLTGQLLTLMYCLAEL